MTIQEVINSFKDIRRASVEEQTLIRWINEAEDEAYIFSFDGKGEPRNQKYTADDLSEELILPAPYSMAYMWYCVYRQDLIDNQIENANNALLKYRECLENYKKYKMRTGTPPDGIRITLEGYNV